MKSTMPSPSQMQMGLERELRADRNNVSGITVSSPHQNRPHRACFGVLNSQRKADEKVSSGINLGEVQPLQDENIIFQKDMVDGLRFVLKAVHGEIIDAHQAQAAGDAKAGGMGREEYIIAEKCWFTHQPSLAVIGLE